MGPKNALILTLTTYFHVPLTVKLENLTWVANITRSERGEWILLDEWH